MPEKGRNTLSKRERICSQKLTEQLFNSGKAHSMVAFPLRAVYMSIPCEEQEPQVSILVSVSKRYFKRAVKRNRVKRLVREAYRLNKHILTDRLTASPGMALAIAFLWLDPKLHSFHRVENKVKQLLQRIAEEMTTCDTSE